MSRAFCPFRLVPFLVLLVGLAACGGAGDSGDTPAVDGAGTSTEVGESQMKGGASPPSTERADEPASVEAATSDEGLYAILHTSMGQIVCRLHYDKVPMTVANFVALAEGGQRWRHPESNEWTTEPLYRGQKFHRVIKDFKVQGGDPLGTGTGGPGYEFADEFHVDLTHQGPGVLSMANSGPGTNGSQFFITHKKTDWLDKRHSVFGQVVRGQGVVDAMAQVDMTGPQRSTPVEDITLDRIEIVRRGAGAEAFDAASHLEAINAVVDAKIAFRKSIEADRKKATTTESGLMYIVLEEGKGPTPETGDRVVTHYDGMFLDGTVFDSSREKGTPYMTTIGVGAVIKGWDEAFLAMKPGEQRRLIVPPKLAYGEAGYPGFIPPNATLVFDVELIEVHRSGQ